jgi:hypothetical protein
MLRLMQWSRMSIIRARRRAISCVSAIISLQAINMIDDHPFAEGAKVSIHLRSGATARRCRGRVSKTVTPRKAPFLPEPPAPPGAGPGARRLHVGCRRQALSRRLVRRDGLQYRPFQSARDRGDAAQMEKSTFGYRLHFETEASEKLAAKTASLTPEGLEPVFFVSGGSEAVESAIKLARQYAVARAGASRWKVISRFPSYHGATLGALALTGYAPLTDAVRADDAADAERSRRRAPISTGSTMDDPATGRHYADMLEAKHHRGRPGDRAGLHSSSRSAARPPARWCRRRATCSAVREICDRYGVLLIHDEVMTGGGRTGKFMAASILGHRARHHRDFQGLRRRLRAARRDGRA